MSERLVDLGFSYRDANRFLEAVHDDDGGGRRTSLSDSDSYSPYERATQHARYSLVCIGISYGTYVIGS